jgi:hypothetical protein
VTEADRSTESEDKPGILDRLRARMPWFDHVIRAQQRYSNCDGDFYAAAITYFTIFALFPGRSRGYPGSRSASAAVSGPASWPPSRSKSSSRSARFT